MLVRRLALYLKLIRADKPVGTWLLLWPTLTALWLASGGVPSASLLWIFILGTFFMRSAGCALNDIADRNFDRHVTRTRDRVLTSAQISVREAFAVALVCLLCSAMLIASLNALVWILASIAVVLAATYPFFKRFCRLPQAYLGIAFSFGIPMAFAAVTGGVPWAAWLLLAANLCWVLAYDTTYALVDKKDDLALGIHSSAIALGAHVVPFIMTCYALFLAGTAFVGWYLGLGAIFFASVVLAAGVAAWHYPLLRQQQPMSCFLAFRTSHWLGAILFSGVVLSLLRA